MHFSKVVVAALSAPLCVYATSKDDAAKDTHVASSHFVDGENHFPVDEASMVMSSVWVDDGGLAPIDSDAWTQAEELRNPENEIDHASRVENDDVEDFAVDIGVLSMERQLSTECASYPVVNETGQLSAGYSSWTPGDFRDLVYRCYNDSPRPELCPDKYGVPLKCWNTSSITDLSFAFYNLTAFNDDISSWDTGKVTDLSWTFLRASSFNSDISSWDIGNVKDLFKTFHEASSFNSDISSWDIGKVTTLSRTFQEASSFNSDISSWDTGKVTTLRSTFAFASNFNSDISSWNTGNVTKMEETFFFASNFNVDISSWDTRKVTDMYETFSFAFDFNVDVSSWNTSNVLTMRRMFYGASEFNQCLGGWAAKTPSTVRTNAMLHHTACPSQSDPDPNKGPWCQGFEERCFGDCSDAEDFRFGRNDQKSCDSIKDITAPTEEKLKKKIRRFCNRKAFRHEEEANTGKPIRVKDVCQEACGSRGFGPGKTCDGIFV